jgi:septal ring factor EnvC (AmiA/AmiB activator)
MAQNLQQQADTMRTELAPLKTTMAAEQRKLSVLEDLANAHGEKVAALGSNLNALKVALSHRKGALVKLASVSQN